MYELSVTQFGPYTRYTLRNPANGTGFSIVPERGATVLDIHFEGTNVVDGYDTPEALEEGKWGKCALLFPFPNRLKEGRYVWEGQSYQFPLNNAATGNAIHGFVRDEIFEVDSVMLARDHASIKCIYNYAGVRPYYPFSFSLSVEFGISDKKKFTLKVKVKNTDNQDIPVGFGWHPYFRLEEIADVHGLFFPACEMVVIDKNMIPTGGRKLYSVFDPMTIIENTFLDNCFHCGQKTGKYALALSSNTHALEVKADARKFPFFQVFTPPHRESVALEPMSCNIDAFNNRQGLIKLAPRKTWSGEFVCTLHKF